MPKDIGDAIEVALHIARESGEPAVIGEIPVTVGLVCFDMDGTLVKMESINALAKAYGKGKEMEKLTLQAMCGEVDFRENFIGRVRMLAGLPVAFVQKLAAEMPCAEGLENLMHNLRSKNIRTAIITGNFNLFGEALKERFGFDYIFTTEPGIENGLLTGEICGEVIDATAKEKILRNLCRELCIPLENTIAVGDGANDIPMLEAAVVAVVYNAISAKKGIDEVIGKIV